MRRRRRRPNILDVPLVRLRVPKAHAILRAIRLVERIDKRLPEMAPPVVGPNVGEKDERVDGERHAK